MPLPASLQATAEADASAAVPEATALVYAGRINDE